MRKACNARGDGPGIGWFSQEAHDPEQWDGDCVRGNAFPPPGGSLLERQRSKLARRTTSSPIPMGTSRPRWPRGWPGGECLTQILKQGCLDVEIRCLDVEYSMPPCLNAPCYCLNRTRKRKRLIRPPSPTKKLVAECEASGGGRAPQPKGAAVTRQAKVGVGVIL